MADIDRDKVLSLLETERETLIHQLAELGADESGELTGDIVYGDAFADAGAATAERTETMGIIDNLKSHLDDVLASIGRIDDGTFGTCLICGVAIGDDRMEYRPTSSRCIACKSKPV